MHDRLCAFGFIARWNRRRPVRHASASNIGGMRVSHLEVHKLAYVAKRTHLVDAQPPYDESFYAVCLAVCSDVDHAFYQDLVVRDGGVLDESDFWRSRPNVTQQVHQLIVNLDGRTGWAQANELIRRHVRSAGEPLHVGVELMAAFFVDDPVLERAWYAHGHANGESATRFWESALGACAHRLWTNEGRATRALDVVSAGTIVDVVSGRFGQKHADPSSPSIGSFDRSTFSDALKKT